MSPDSHRQVTDKALVMRRWFTDGWAGEVQLADHTFGAHFSNNGVVVGPAGPKRNIRNRLAAFPDLTTVVEQLLTVGDTAVLRLRWSGTHSGPYLGVPATGKRVDVRGMTTWRFVDGRVVEDWTVGHIPLAIFGIDIPAPVPVERRS